MTDRTTSRRNALAAAGVIGGVALAGCTGENGGGNNGSVSDSQGQEVLTPPDAPAIPNDRYWAYVVESLEYQNAALQELLTED